MRRLICTFVVCIWHKQGFSWCGSNGVKLGSVLALFSMIFRCSAGLLWLSIPTPSWWQAIQLRKAGSQAKGTYRCARRASRADNMANTPQQRGRCKELWIEFHRPMLAMTSKSALTRLRLCTSQHLESCTESTKSRQIHLSWKHSVRPVQTLTSRWTQELLKPVLHLADYVETFWIEVESGLTQNLQGCGTANPQICIHVIPHSHYRF